MICVPLLQYLQQGFLNLLQPGACKKQKEGHYYVHISHCSLALMAVKDPSGSKLPTSFCSFIDLAAFFFSFILPSNPLSLLLFRIFLCDVLLCFRCFFDDFIMYCPFSCLIISLMWVYRSFIAQERTQPEVWQHAVKITIKM